MMNQPEDERSGTKISQEDRMNNDGNKKAAGAYPRQENKNTTQATQKQVANQSQASNAENQNRGGAPSNASFWQKVKTSFHDSVGQIVFGMEDGTVSIFGLVFGMASTAANSHAVFLAGATGAAAAAVSMMAGAYLDVESTRAKAHYQINQEKQEIQNNPQEEQREVRGRLQNAGFSYQEINQMIKALKNNPEAMLEFEKAYELQVGTAANESPVGQAVWMFLADLVAASIPVIPFAFAPLGTARWISIGVTGTLLLALGVGRALIAKTNMWWTIVETLLIAALAGGAGVGIGLLFKG